MRAAVYDRYGGPIAAREVPTPAPKPGEVLVRVMAASVNSWDWDKFAGVPMIRPEGLFVPRHRILGADIAGVVESVGEGVDTVSPGDAVVGEVSEHGWGGFAEFVAVPASVLVSKPAGLGFEAAAAIPQAGTLALQAVRQRRSVEAGERILINGAGGGMGSFAIQLAKLAGAHVTGVDHGDKLDFMHALGADAVIDYGREDFATSGQRYDRIIECVARRPVAAYRGCLSPTGILVVVGGRIRTLLAVALAGAGSKPEGQQVGLLMWRSLPADYAELLALCADGTITAAVDGVHALEETGAALARIGAGRSLGKVVVRMAGGAA